MRRIFYSTLVIIAVVGLPQSSMSTVLLTDIPWNTYGGDYNPWTNANMGQQFSTDNHSYQLNSVVLTLADNYASSAGGFSVSIWSSTGSGPASDYGSLLETLSTQGSFFSALSGSPYDNPTDVTFTSTGIILTANTNYWIRVVNPNSYAWLNVYGGPFSLFGAVDNGQGAKAMGNPFTATVNVTSVPEPSTGILLVGGLVVAELTRRRNRS